MKETLISFLEYCIERLKKDECTMDEIVSASKLISQELELNGTISDFAKFFGQSETNVRTVLARRFIPKDKKPQRKVYYSFSWFNSMVPKSWRK